MPPVRRRPPQPVVAAAGSEFTLGDQRRHFATDWLRETTRPDIDDELPIPAVFVVLLHGAGCDCRINRGTHIARPASCVVGPFVAPAPNELLAWAKAECSQGLIARMVDPGRGPRMASGARFAGDGIGS